MRADITRHLPENLRRLKEFLDRKPEQLLHRYGASVLTTWGARYEAVQRRDPQAGQFLTSLGWLHWDDIFMSIFERPAGLDKTNETS